MAATTLIIGQSTRRRQEISDLAESTQLFDRILHSSTPRETLAMLENFRIDLIFFGMEKLSKEAFEWTRYLKQRAEWSDIPLLALAAEGSEEDRIIGFESGASDCLTYATSTKEAAARIHRYLANKRRMDQLRKANADLARQSLTDELTGLGNRRFFHQTLEAEASRSSRSATTYSLMLVDLDHFKSINDTYGHPAGDAVLRAVSAALRRSLRKPDTVCRFGGEEFALIMPGTSSDAAHLVAERVRARIASLTPAELGIDLRVTASIGISTASGRGSAGHLEIIEEADQALYRAKENGRNRTEVYADGKRFFPSAFFSGQIDPATLARAI
ncbi:diguanylate cyclase response regulator [Desulfuromonas versatilis]|uniref:diguanylate cyclase n=1 Tax=Desulfuromonas versatilis TaxID=2802975 RepID=A0ABM8HTU8_9BACT|nr:diguanylate cyclase [Desulfuromonas versatilis]BCR04126.1 diguanylate cyclase response regulator [Desulfuromonas versatilis]